MKQNSNERKKNKHIYPDKENKHIPVIEAPRMHNRLEKGAHAYHNISHLTQPNMKANSSQLKRFMVLKRKSQGESHRSCSGVCGK